MEKTDVSGPAAAELGTDEDGIVLDFSARTIVRAESQDSLLPYDNRTTEEAVDSQNEAKLCGVRVKLLNVIFLGLGFMFNIGAILTTAMAQVSRALSSR